MQSNESSPIMQSGSQRSDSASPNSLEGETHSLNNSAMTSSMGANVSPDQKQFNNYLNRGSELWTHWTWLGGQGKMSLMQCNYCLSNKQLKNAPKCRRHLIRCTYTPEHIKKYFEKKEAEATNASAFMKQVRAREIKIRNILNHNNDSDSSDNVNQQQQQQQQPKRQEKNFRQELLQLNSVSEEPKLPMPTANDLRHLQNKQNNNNGNLLIASAQSVNTSRNNLRNQNTHRKSDNVNVNSNNNKPAINNVLTTPNRANGNYVQPTPQPPIPFLDPNLINEMLMNNVDIDQVIRLMVSLVFYFRKHNQKQESESLELACVFGESIWCMRRVMVAWYKQNLVLRILLAYICPLTLSAWILYLPSVTLSSRPCLFPVPYVHLSPPPPGSNRASV